MSRRNKAAILTRHIDGVEDRLVDITSPLASGNPMTQASIGEYTKWFKVRAGLKIMLAEYGGIKRGTFLLTQNGSFKSIDQMVTHFGNQVQNLRANEGMTIERLTEHDAAYTYLSSQLKEMKTKRDAQSARKPASARLVPDRPGRRM